MEREWRFEIVCREPGEVSVSLYELDEDQAYRFIDAEVFGPFDSALDVTLWLLRHWGPRARLPMR